MFKLFISNMAHIMSHIYEIINYFLNKKSFTVSALTAFIHRSQIAL